MTSLNPSGGISRHGRTIILVIGLVVLCSGVVLCIAAPHAPGLPPLILGALITGSVLFEGRYRRANAGAAPQGPGWAETGEVFRDEESGGWVRVWANAGTGERRYVPEDAARP